MFRISKLSVARNADLITGVSRPFRTARKHIEQCLVCGAPRILIRNKIGDGHSVVTLEPHKGPAEIEQMIKDEKELIERLDYERALRLKKKKQQEENQILVVA